MTEFPDNIKFKYGWREYQQRVLNDLLSLLSDDHLHIIAPPGSGKTILGLEVAIRLNKPTLILAPTIAIRNQWIQRFCELFLQTNQVPGWISHDIYNPRFMTVVTYQGLHAACNNLKDEELKEEEAEEETNEEKNGKTGNANINNIVNGLKSQNIKTIVVDEAHHLKNEWWQTLTLVKENLSPVIVGLTATPPYDVTATEWHRYSQLNGPVDTEISIPELVIAGDLCPHQDYVYFSLPTEREIKKITDFRENAEHLLQEIRQEETLLRAIESYPALQNPHDYLEWIYTNLRYYSACLIFLKDRGKEISKIHLEVIGDKKLEVPAFNYEWAEILLQFYLIRQKESFHEFKDHQQKLENKLKRYGVIENQQINFSLNKQLVKSLISSMSKLDSIGKIVDFEYVHLKEGLRMVILCDFIRKEYYITASENNIELNKMGVLPVFEKLRRSNTDHKKIGVLTGSLIIIPKSAYNLFKEKCNEYQITEPGVSPVPFDDNYILINQTEQIRNDIVSIITQVFRQGGIEVLIGTKSLLGEGWDAPEINSLILASFVGSFVLSNQMRGRAIRTQRNNPNKTGNIWHLVCIDPTSPKGGEDMELLRRRFRSFVGISFKESPGIENGIGRLNLPSNMVQKEGIEKANTKMLAFAGDREGLKQRWHEGLKTGVRLVEEIKVPFFNDREYKATKTMYLNKTIGNFLAMLGFGVLSYMESMMQGFVRLLRYIKSVQDFYLFFSLFAGLGFLIFGRLAYKTFRLYLKYRDISKDIQKIGEALLHSLIEVKVIHSDQSTLKVVAVPDDFGSVYCRIEGGTSYEISAFINALKEIIDPIDNPRYLIVRKSRSLFILKKKDYHAVPEVLGRNKESAEYLCNQWKKLVGSCELIFTRNIEGRKLLLQPRMKALSAQFDTKAEHVNQWR